jgi:hypothetical protein
VYGSHETVSVSRRDVHYNMWYLAYVSAADTPGFPLNVTVRGEKSTTMSLKISGVNTVSLRILKSSADISGDRTIRGRRLIGTAPGNRIMGLPSASAIVEFSMIIDAGMRGLEAVPLTVSCIHC